MLDGWRVAEQSAGEILIVFIAVVVAMAVAYGSIEAALAVAIKDRVAKDERDALIEGRAARNELVALNTLMNIGVFHLLLNATFNTGRVPFVNLAHMPTLAFAIFTALWIGEFVRLVSILSYTRA